MQTEGRLPPQCVEIERALLGSALTIPGCPQYLAEHLLAEDFYSNVHQEVFSVISAMVQQNIEVDIMTVHDKSAGKIDITLLMELSNSATTPNLEYHVKRIKDAAKMRSLIQTCIDGQERAYSGEEEASDILTGLQAKLFEIDRANAVEGPIRVGDLLSNVFAQIESMSSGHAMGLSTGLKDVDKITTGLQKKDLTILAARPSMGKTALAIQIGMCMAKQGNKCLVFSLEMGRDQLTLRQLCADAGVNMHRLRAGMMPKRDFPLLAQSADGLITIPAWIDDTPGNNPVKMMSRARRIKKLFGLDIVIVDYLQLCRSGEKHQSREQEIARISSSLKALAKDLDCHVMALSQLSRAVESRNDKRPMMSDLRESGAIEQDADNVMFLYRDAYYDKNSAKGNVCELILGKQRNGPTGTVELYFEPHTMRFENLEGE